MASGFIEQPYDLSFKYFSNINYVSSRAEAVDGGIRSYGNLTVINITFKALATASNSPQIGSVIVGTYPRGVIALSCIDITDGIGSAITSSVPCGIDTNGKIYMKEITTNHIYALSGCYIHD